jgi:hypothetical protein
VAELPGLNNLIRLPEIGVAVRNGVLDGDALDISGLQRFEESPGAFHLCPAIQIHAILLATADV